MYLENPFHRGIMRTRISISVFIITILGGALALSCAGGGGKKASTQCSIDDGRRPITVTLKERDFILRIMRDYIVVMQKSYKAIGKEDRKALSMALRSGGKGVAKKFPKDLMKRFPLGFRTIGLEMTKGFEAMADDVDKGADKAKIMDGLNREFNKCVACHLNFRLVVQN